VLADLFTDVDHSDTPRQLSILFKSRFIMWLWL